MSEHRWKPSVTVAAVIEQQGRYLLVEEETVDGLRLNNPAGHLEQGETPLQAVRREALEETARTFEPEALLGLYMVESQSKNGTESVTYLRFAYCGTVTEPEPGRRLDDGIVRTFRAGHASDSWINGGFFIFRPGIFEFMRPGEELVVEPFQRLIEARELIAYRHRGFWASMDTLRDKQLLEDMLDRGDTPWLPWTKQQASS